MKILYRAYLIAFLLLCGSILRAEPYGILTEAVEDTTHSTYAADFLIGGKTIHYAVAATVTPEEEKIFVENIKKWPREVARIITEESNDRTNEFQDVLPILQRDVSVQKVKPTSMPRNIFLDFFPPEKAKKICKDEDATGCVKNDLPCPSGASKHCPGIFISEKTRQHRKDFTNTLLHEVGHFYGLGDQYDPNRANSHPEYSSNVNEEEGALMQGSDVTDGQITCDDADGLINLLDVLLAKRNNGQFSKRARDGWKSLCKSSKNIYVEGRTENRGSDTIYHTMPNGDEIPTTFEYEKGRLTRKTSIAPSEQDGSTMMKIVSRYKNSRLTQEITTWTSISGFMKVAAVSEAKDGDISDNGNVTRQLFVFFSPLQIFSVTPDDKVTYDPKTHLITQVTTRLPGIVEEEETKGPNKNYIQWTKKFSYNLLSSGLDKRYIQVDEFINGEKVNTREITLMSGDYLVDSSELELEAARLYIHPYNEEITFSLKNGKILKFTRRTESEKPAKIIVGIPNKTLSISTEGGKTSQEYLWTSDQAFLDNQDETLKDTVTAYKENQNYLISFYTNFYGPLFPYARQNQIIFDVQQGLRGGK